MHLILLLVFLSPALRADEALVTREGESVEVDATRPVSTSSANAFCKIKQKGTIESIDEGILTYRLTSVEKVGVYAGGDATSDNDQHCDEYVDETNHVLISEEIQVS